ncbi:protein of unknown function [Methylocaldum szegediense]|uniref:Secreted protein n=1 Tax=Methylocaldum szegediense TaxID=73780 RepID=A0ABN8X1C6_9GAMM|nr:protein of unknown function [Methylocaldum szegediense]
MRATCMFSLVILEPKQLWMTTVILAWYIRDIAGERGTETTFGDGLNKPVPPVIFNRSESRGIARSKNSL